MSLSALQEARAPQEPWLCTAPSLVAVDGVDQHTAAALEHRLDAVLITLRRTGHIVDRSSCQSNGTLATPRPGKQPQAVANRAVLQVACARCDNTGAGHSMGRPGRKASRAQGLGLVGGRSARLPAGGPPAVLVVSQHVLGDVVLHLPRVRRLILRQEHPQAQSCLQCLSYDGFCSAQRSSHWREHMTHAGVAEKVLGRHDDWHLDSCTINTASHHEQQRTKSTFQWTRYSTTALPLPSTLTRTPRSSSMSASSPRP